MHTHPPLIVPKKWGLKVGLLSAKYYKGFTVMILKKDCVFI